MTDRYLVGLFGKNILKSLSPALHEDAFRAAGAEGFYHLMDFNVLQGRDLPAMIEAIRQAGFAGVNVTLPFKEAILPHLDAVSDQARQIGAVNTLVIGKDGKTTGHNTDRPGFRRGFEVTLGRHRAEGQSVLLIGTGGAGRAVAWSLLDLGVRELHVFDTDPTRAKTLAEEINQRTGSTICRVASDPADVTATVAGIVNATPIGMLGFPGVPIPLDLVERRHWVADVIYTPLVTDFIKQAQAKGCETVTGGGMCVYQAAEAFTLFTGLEPDVDRMTKLFTDMVTKRDAVLIL